MGFSLRVPGSQRWYQLTPFKDDKRQRYLLSERGALASHHGAELELELDRDYDADRGVQCAADPARRQGGRTLADMMDMDQSKDEER